MVCLTTGTNMAKWKCTNCKWHGEETEISKVEYFTETQLEPSEWLWHCPECNFTELDEDTNVYCRNCDEEPVSDEGEQCPECYATDVERHRDDSRSH